MTGLPAYRIAQSGIARTFQLVRMLPAHDVRSKTSSPAWRSAATASGARPREREAAALLAASAWRQGRDARPADLTYIDQKRMELARALASDPTLLLLDEWLAGLNPTELQDGIALIRSLRDDGIDHHAGRARHGRGPLAVRPLHRDERRRHDRRRADRRGAGRPEVVARLSGGRPMLEVGDLSVSYGKHLALQRVAWRVARGEIVVILGANGAGKTTLLKASPGWSPAAPTAACCSTGDDISGSPPHDIVEAGIALVPEGRGIFGELTVRENLELGAYRQRARVPAKRDSSPMVLELFPRLAERLRQTVRTMSGGEQQMLAIGRALMSVPAHADARRAFARPRAHRDARSCSHALRASGRPASA